MFLRFAKQNISISFFCFPFEIRTSIFPHTLVCIKHVQALIWFISPIPKDLFRAEIACSYAFLNTSVIKNSNELSVSGADASRFRRMAPQCRANSVQGNHRPRTSEHQAWSGWVSSVMLIPSSMDYQVSSHQQTSTETGT
jgi:hypothetical protein